MTENIVAYWKKFLSTLPSDSPYRSKTYIAEGWGDSPEMADELGALIAQGTKTATCSALWEWESEGNPIPRKAHKNYFSRVLLKIGKEFSEDMPLVCERFRIIYK
jgi:uncharacterized protein YhfF